MTTPILITPPRDAIVPLADLRAHLRVDSDAEDALITSLADAAAAWLDGWTGVLGRAVMPQTWAVDLEAGEHVLPLPDVTAARVDGVSIPVTVSCAGPVVTLAEAARVEFDCALPVHRLPQAQAVVKMLVAAWHGTREAVVVGTITAQVPLAVESLVAALRWRHL